VIQKGFTVTYLLHEDVRGQKSAMCHWRNHISTLRYALVYIYIYIYIVFVIIVMREIAGGRNLSLKSWILKDLSAFRGTTHWK
jgi:hypothetical protein